MENALERRGVMVLSDYHATKTATNHVLGLAYAAESGTEGETVRRILKK